ncbi:hypothetical protein LTR66_007046 [Elasticomyces elasticus]|nr:hypothetical protein LTR66_007046 [Elasticomyces elasticus]
MLALPALALASPLFHRQDNGTANATLSCGGQPYFATNYTCTNGTQLCPILNGIPTLACGPACYSPSRYSCTNGYLSQVNITTDGNYTTSGNYTRRL